MTHKERAAVDETIATLRKLNDKWWGQTVDDLKRHWGKYQGKWVAFEGSVANHRKQEN